MYFNNESPEKAVCVCGQKLLSMLSGAVPTVLQFIMSYTSHVCCNEGMQYPHSTMWLSSLLYSLWCVVAQRWRLPKVCGHLYVTRPCVIGHMVAGCHLYCEHEFMDYSGEGIILFVFITKPLAFIVM